MIAGLETPDATIDHYPAACAVCGEPLSAAMASGVRRAVMVLDPPEPRPLIVTEHRVHSQAARLQHVDTRGAFPDGVTAPVQVTAHG